jgi:hypothetical protein
VNEWSVIALIVEKWGLPGAVLAGIAWAMWRFGPTPSAPHPVQMSNETADAIRRLSDKIDANHTTAQGQHEKVMNGLHGLDLRLAVLETTVAERKR